MRLRFLGLVLGLATLAPAYSLAQDVDSGPTHHSGRMDTNEVWYPSGNPHILDHAVYTGNNVTLTVMPGCVVKAEYGVELYVGYAQPGTIVAAGTADSVITFTSNVTSPQPGDWRGVGIYGLARNTTRFSYCDFSYAGGTSGYGTFYVDGIAPSFDHCSISLSGDFGVVVKGGGRFSSFADNAITSCAGYPVDIQASYAHTLGPGNVLTGNSQDGILIRGRNVLLTGTWLNHGVPYVIDGDVAVQDANCPVLTIAAGTKLMLRPGTEFYVGYAAPGGLVADGTAGQIEFTSSVTPPSPGDWVGVSFYLHSISSLCKLINCKVEYAGRNDYGNIHILDCVPEVVGDSIGHSSAWGIYLEGSVYPDPELLLANNTFYDCASGAVGPDLAVAEMSLAPGRAIEPVTIVRGVLRYQPTANRSHQTAELLDITGRKVMGLQPGPNDVSTLAPGVYFVRSADSRERSAVTR